MIKTKSRPLQSTYWRGFQAFSKGAKREACLGWFISPTFIKAWQQGWDDAALERLEKVEK